MKVHCSRGQRGSGISNLIFYRTPAFKYVVRAVDAIDEFDRIQLKIIAGPEQQIAFGTISRILSQMQNEGYIGRTGLKRTYSKRALRRNPDLVGLKFNYSRSDDTSSVILTKTGKWTEFMERWREFLSAGDQT